MNTKLLEKNSLRLLVLPEEGPRVESADELISEAWGQALAGFVVPVARLDERFFTLSSGVAGELVQRLVNYRLRLVILGDISARVAQSQSLRDFVYESNRGSQVWFLADEVALLERLSRLGAP